MKAEIHPQFHAAQVHCVCGNAFTVGSTTESIRVEVCNKCHPFYTGTPNSVDTAGPRPATPYWSTVVNAMLGRWHPADSVNEGTAASSATFVRDVLDGNALN